MRKLAKSAWLEKIRLKHFDSNNKRWVGQARDELFCQQSNKRSPSAPSRNNLLVQKQRQRWWSHSHVTVLLFFTINLALEPFTSSFFILVITLRYSFGFIPVWALKTTFAFARYSRSYYRDARISIFFLYRSLLPLWALDICPPRDTDFLNALSQYLHW